MMRCLLTLLLLALSATSSAAVMAYSVADDNFEFPDHLVQINLETGEFTSLGQIADPYIALEGLAISEAGTLYGADDNTKTLVQIATNTAQAFPVANVNQNFGFGSVPESYDFGLTFSCGDKLNMVVKHTGEFYTVNSMTGVASLVGDTGHNFTSLAAWGNDLYAIASGDFNLYKINPVTAEATLVGPLGDLGGGIELNGSGLAFDPDGQLWLAINLRLSDPLNPFPSRIFKVDIENGAAEFISETLVGIESLAITGPAGCDSVAGSQNIPVPALDQQALLVLLLVMLAAGALAVNRQQP
jgi:hypothetical protein